MKDLDNDIEKDREEHEKKPLKKKDDDVSRQSSIC